MSVDMAAALQVYPVDLLLGIKRFFRECKHRVDCNQRRKQQWSQLEILIAKLNLQNCSVQPDTDFTRISLKLAIHGIVRSCTNTGRNIVVDLCYRSNETRQDTIAMFYEQHIPIASCTSNQKLICINQIQDAMYEV